MSVKVISWNIWIDSYFDQIKDFLKNSDADALGLQEVLENDSKRDVISFLEGLGYKYVFAPIEKTWNGEKWSDGPAIFTKHEIVGSETFILSNEDKRAAVRADIKIGDKILHVFSTHLLHTHQDESEIQNQQAKALVKLLPDKSTIVVGDFNATPESKTIKTMQESLIDTDPSSQSTWSLYEKGCYKCKLKELKYKLDYIFTTKDILISAFEVGNSQGSDHLPILATVEI